jgi:hypothetical protein
MGGNDAANGLAVDAFGRSVDFPSSSFSSGTSVLIDASKRIVLGGDARLTNGATVFALARTNSLGQLVSVCSSEASAKSGSEGRT